ncbi:MAG: AAA family ATPase [Actinobacteria bacterium]|nr:AAA family ATPase [Actinomycetota bacterium]
MTNNVGKMRISSLSLEHFRAFSNTTISFGSFNILVGPNNCGKTSILHAIRLLLSITSDSFEDKAGRIEFHRRYIPISEIGYIPKPDELWTDGKKTKSPIVMRISFDIGIEIELKLKYQFGQIHASAELLKNPGLVSSEINSFLRQKHAFIPALVGMLVQEPYVTPARRLALSAEARYPEMFRSSLYHLQKSSRQSINRINKILKETLDVEIVRISFDPDKDEYVQVLYQQNGVEHDLVSAGSGMQQIIQLLSYIYLHKPEVILIDEPDAHLHPELQIKVAMIIQQMAEDLGAQVFLSTHSPEVIDGFSPENIYFIDSSKKTISAVKDENEYVSGLFSAGVLTLSSLSRIAIMPNCFVIEDKKEDIHREIDKALRTGLMNEKSRYRCASGVTKFQAIYQLYETVQSVIGKKIEIHFLQDRDGLPDKYVEYIKQFYNRKKMNVHILERHEIENYILDVKYMLSALREKGVEAKERDVRSLLVKAAENEKQNARRHIREQAKNVNRICERPDDLDDRRVEMDVDEWFDKIDWRKERNIVKYFPGKETLKDFRQLVHDEYGVDITEAQLIRQINRRRIAEDVRKIYEEIASSKKQ